MPGALSNSLALGVWFRQPSHVSFLGHIRLLCPYVTGLWSAFLFQWHVACVLVGARGMYGSGGTGSCRGGEGHCPLLFVFFFLSALWQKAFICRGMRWGSFSDTELGLACGGSEWGERCHPLMFLFHIFCLSPSSWFVLYCFDEGFTCVVVQWGMSSAIKKDL